MVLRLSLTWENLFTSRVRVGLHPRSSEPSPRGNSFGIPDIPMNSQFPAHRFAAARPFSLALAASFLAVSVVSADAATLTWNVPGTANWTAANWGGTLPTSNDDLIFSNPGNNANNTAVLLNGTSGFYRNLSMGSSYNQSVGLTVRGTLTGTSANVGSRAAVSVDGGSWTNSGALNINLYSNFSVTNGGSVSAASSAIGGDFNVISGANVTVTSGTFGVTGSLLLNGQSTLLINGGSVTSGSSVIGQTNSSRGTVTVSSGTWTNSGDLTVGYAGYGTLSVSNTGRVSVGNTLTINSQSPVTVSGTSSARGTLSFLNFANNGATFTVDGGVLQARGNNASFVNGVTINGNGAFLDTAGFTIGASGFSGTGALTEIGGGALTLSGTNTYTGGTTVKAGALTVTGSITHPAAETRIGDTTGDNGGLTLNGGSISDTYGFLGFASGATGSATITTGTWTNSMDLYVGYGGAGTLQLNGGTVSARSVFLGNNSGSTGSLTIAGGSLTTTSNLLVGNGSNGTLNITGGTVTSGSTSLIALGGTGTVNSTGGTWNITGDLLVGSGGNGTLSVGNGGVVGVSGNVIANPGSTGGTITLSGTSGARGVLAASQVVKGGSSATLNFAGGILRARADQSNFLSNYASGDVTIGTGGAFIDSNGFAIGISVPLTGSGNLTKLGAGTLSLTAANTYGYDQGTTVKGGTLALPAGGSITTVQGNTIVGESSGDNAALLINGGSMTNFRSYLGNVAGSTGSATVTSGNWNTAFELYVGNAGTGSLLVNGGSVSNTDAFVGNGGSGTVTVSSGSWASSGDLTLGKGTLSISGGSVTNAAGSVGSLGTGTANVTGGTWTNSSNLTIGAGNTGILSMTAGTLKDAAGVVGSGAGGVGSATISGGTWTNSSDLSIGSNGGKGTLLLDGGAITSASGGVFGSTSQATLTSGSWNATGGFSVNAGTLLINGGTLISRGGTISGTTTVTSGSWNTNRGQLTGDLNISAGGGATARLTINGGSVTDNYARVAFGGFQNAAVTVTSGTWTNLADIFVAATGGTGSVLVNGGTVTAANSGIGAGGSGSATITSGLWSNGGDFTVGYNSTGSLTLSGTSGNRGVLQAGRVVEGTGTGTVSIDGGILKAAGNQSDFLSGFEAGDVTVGTGGIFVDSNGFAIGISHSLGGGALTKIGAGTLTLTGTNTSNGTVVKSGTLNLGSGGSITHNNVDAVIGEATGDNAALVIDGGTLSNAQSYIGSGGATGSVTVNSGTWQTFSNTFIGYNGGHGTLTINGGVVSGSSALIGDNFAGGTGTAVVTGGTWNTGNIVIGSTGAGSLSISGGAVNVTFSSQIGYAGAQGSLTLSGVAGNRGVLQLGTLTEGTGSGTVLFNGGVLQSREGGSLLNGFEAGDVTIAAGGAFIDSQNFQASLNAPLSGVGGLTKLGDGTLTLSGTNTYTGPTDLSYGTLLVTGDNSAAGAVTVRPGATLGGIGSVNDVVVQNLATLRPGVDGPGLLTVAGDLTMNLNATLVLDFTGTGAGAFDQIAIRDMFTAGGTLSLQVGYAAAVGDTFTVFTDGLTGRGWNSGGFTITTNLGNGLTWDTSKLGTDGMLTVVPEPATWALLGLGFLLVVGRLRCSRASTRAAR